MNIHSQVPVRLFAGGPGGMIPMTLESLNASIPMTLGETALKADAQVTYKAYLEAVRRFILDNFDQVLEALKQRCTGISQAVASIDLIAEKHGSEYHPARVREYHHGGSVTSFVADVALSDRGRSRLEEDFRLLRHLREKFGEYGRRFLPEPYFKDSVNVYGVSGGEIAASAFLAEWFEGYHEFHLSVAGAGPVPAAVLWDNDAGHCLLSVEEASEIYRQASFILTCLYDTETFQEVFPWHHAAGDFIASRCGGRIDVKLVTVRQYAPRVTFDRAGASNRMEALLFFLANLTVRMRLDRLDGVGDIAWADVHCVDAAVRGFRDALTAKENAGQTGPDLIRDFKDFLSSLSLTDLVEVFRSVVESYDSEAPDVPVVVKHLPEHIFQVFERLRVAV